MTLAMTLLLTLTLGLNGPQIPLAKYYPSVSGRPNFTKYLLMPVLVHCRDAGYWFLHRSISAVVYVINGTFSFVTVNTRQLMTSSRLRNLSPAHLHTTSVFVVESWHTNPKLMPEYVTSTLNLAKEVVNSCESLSRWQAVAASVN